MPNRFLLMTAGLLACIACSPAPDTQAPAAIQEAPAGRSASAGEHAVAINALFSEYAQPGSPGVAVGVYHQGKRVFAKGYGLADVEAGTPITPQTRFHVASVSKQFTAFSVALLAREGRVDLDADIRTYLPYVPDFGHKITVRHLILHTSGLRDQWSLFEVGGRSLDDRLSQAQIVNMVSRQRTLNFTPGTQRIYSNMGYTLLGEIVKAASGRTLRQFTTERIFKPLGMDSTFFFDDVEEIVPGRANSYDREDKDKPWRRALLNYDNAGATSLFTTVEDMARWAGNFTTPKVGDRALIDQVTSNGTLDDGTPTEYAFGLIRKQMGGHAVVTHTGSDAGFRSIFVYYPDDDFAVILTANTPIDLGPKVEAIADLYLSRPVEAKEVPAPAPPPEDPNADPASLAGLYVQPDHELLRLRLEDGKVFRTSQLFRREYVVMRRDGSFDFGKPQEQRFRPVRDAGGKVTALETRGRGGDGVLNYARVAPPQLDAAALAAYAGRYSSDELDITYEVTVQDGEMVLSSLWMPAPVPLEPLARDYFGPRRLFPNEFPSDAGMVFLFQRDGGRIRSLAFNSFWTRGIVLERVE